MSVFSIPFQVYYNHWKTKGLPGFLRRRSFGPVAQYPFWLSLLKSGYDLLKIPRNSPAIPHNFQLRLARILKELSQKDTGQQCPFTGGTLSVPYTTLSVVGTDGVEPSTSSLSVTRSNQLSYVPLYEHSVSQEYHTPL